MGADMILDLRAMTPASRASLERVRTDILGLLEGRKPRTLLFYNAHSPLEPMEKQARALARAYDPETLTAVEYPSQHTPLGFYCRAFDLMEASARVLAKGETTFEGIPRETVRQVGEGLLRFFGIAMRRKLRRLAGLLADITYSSREVNEERIHAFAREIEQKTGLDGVAGKGGIIRRMVSSLGTRMEEEHVVAALHPHIPSTSFLSLHAQFGMPSVVVEHQFPWHRILATEKEYEALRSRERHPDFGVSKLPYQTPIPFLNSERFTKEVHFSAVELFYPVHYLAATAAPFRGLRLGSTLGEAAERAFKAAIARYFLQDDDKYLLYDYFLPLGVFENDKWHEHHAEDMRKYVEWRHGKGTPRPPARPG
jgi:hypothetical protein